MIDCRGITTQTGAEELLSAQSDRLGKIWESIPKGTGGIAGEPGLSKYRMAYDEYDAARRYLIRRGLIWEETEDIYAGY